MELNIYAMFDKLDGCHKALVTHRSDARAVHTFMEEMENFKQKNPSVKLDLSDFELHKLGVYDDVDGVIHPISPVEVLPLAYPKEE